ncbi:MAG: polysaccharide biosynthesis/export family protein [Gemmatimonadaceae bacterium]|nr:polysaccharide biosynthesis/export family protein [Gemmatimonadaceae bacterium]
MTVRLPQQKLPRRLLALAVVVLAACGPKSPVVLAPLPDRPWTVLPGDEVKVRVYREPELSGQYVVNGRGEVFIPGLGRIAAAGMTADSLSAHITNGYMKRIIDAIVDVGLLRSLPVLGQVQNPGVYQAEPTMSVQQIVAKAGGIRGTSLEAPTILLQKGRDGTRYSLAADVRLDRIALDEGDAIVVVNPSWLERSAPGLAILNQFAGTISIVLSILLLSKK